jgi:glycosyltransferase involved in cell wall biosynthesis
VRLVYDAHEIYADQEPDAPRLHRALVRLLEGPLARRADAVVTVSEPIAEELRDSLRLAAKPLVVLSCPPRTQVELAPRGEGPLLALYQGAMGPGRRLEDLAVAAAHADGVRLTARVPGAPDLDGVERAEPVEPDELVEAAAAYHVGLVINRPVTRNDELVLPNKLFEYLMAGLAVVVPRLPGLAPLVESEGVGLTYEPGRPEALGAVLTELARDAARLAEMRARGRRLALERFNAESQVPVLLHAWGASPEAS